jgi:hypothetical protein
VIAFMENCGARIMLLKNIRILFYITFLFVFAGCDPARTTLQPVRLQIINSVSKQSIPGASVEMKFDYDRFSAKKEQTANERKRWEKWSGNTGITDKQGQIVIEVKWTVLDRSIGPEPPAWRDWVSGRPYLIKVKKGQLYEEFNLVMKPDTLVHGKTFSVYILDIQKPRYVKMKTRVR